jgi:hypothetical protein
MEENVSSLLFSSLSRIHQGAPKSLILLDLHTAIIQPKDLLATLILIQKPTALLPHLSPFCFPVTSFSRRLSSRQWRLQCTHSNQLLMWSRGRTLHWKPLPQRLHSGATSKTYKVRKPQAIVIMDSKRPISLYAHLPHTPNQTQDDDIFNFTPIREHKSTPDPPSPIHSAASQSYHSCSSAVQKSATSKLFWPSFFS